MFPSAPVPGINNDQSLSSNENRQQQHIHASSFQEKNPEYCDINIALLQISAK